MAANASDSNPWQVTSSEVKYQNPWISVREDKVVRPDGQPGIFGVVTMQPGVSVLALDAEANVYLVEEYRYGVARKTIEVVSGGIEPGSTVLASAQRELKEETGLTAKSWTDLGALDPFTSVVVSPAGLFLAEGLTQGEQQLEGTEKINLMRVPLTEAVRMVMQSEITHGQSVALILKTWLHINGANHSLAP